MRKTLIAGNWKMNNNNGDTALFFDEFLTMLGGEKCEVVLCVPYTDIAAAVKAVKNSPVKIGAQNVAWSDKGAFTGEISAAMLCELGCEYVIIGHSERRAMFGESDESVNKRLLQALKYALKPIVCVGETLAEREQDKMREVISRQLKAGLKGIDKDAAAQLTVAYEPVWAIGTGKTATAVQAGEAADFIRAQLTNLFGDAAAGIRILYGGSMNGGNAGELMKVGIDGGLIGGASLKPQEFIKVVCYDKPVD